jgi:hypothetical protein
MPEDPVSGSARLVSQPVGAVLLPAKRSGEPPAGVSTSSPLVVPAANAIVDGVAGSQLLSMSRNLSVNRKYGQTA